MTFDEHLRRLGVCGFAAGCLAMGGPLPDPEPELIDARALALNQLDVFGRTHTATGNAQLGLSPTGVLVVSNIGSSGLDGVTFPIGDVRGHSMTMDIGDLGALSAGGLVEVCHPYSFGDQTVYLREDVGGNAMLGFSTTNPTGRCATVTILDNGTPVAQHDLDDDGFGDFGDLVSGAMGSDPTTGRGITINTSQVEWAYVCTVTLPVDSQLTLTGPGQTPVTGDQISISLHGLPPGETVTGDIRVTCSNLGQDLEIRGERSILGSTQSRRGVITALHPPGNPGNGYARVIPFGAVQTTGTPEAVFCNTFPNWGQQLDSLSPERGLTVSNIGSSGLDGVSISYGDTTPCGPGFFTCPDGSCVADPADCDTVPADRVVYFGRKDLAAPDYLDLDDDGDSLRLGATGVMGGTFGTDFGHMTLTNAAGGDNELGFGADFSAIGSDLVRVAVYNGGAFVGEFEQFTQPGVPLGQITPSAAGIDIASCGKFVGGPPFGPPCFFFTTADVFTLTGPGQILVGDECRVLAAGNPTPIDFISTLDITGTNLEPFDMRLQSEQDVWTDTGSGTVALGTLMHAEGDATVGTTPGGGLVVSNIGSSGLDGVRVPIGDASGASFVLEAGGNFTANSFFDFAYSISQACCLHDDDPDDLCMGLYATTPDQVALTGTATDPTAPLTVTPRDQFGNALGSFTMDQTQAASVSNPSGIPLKIKAVDVGHRRDPIGDTIVEFAVCHFAADPGGGGGTTLTSPAGISYPDVYSVEVSVARARPFDHKDDGHMTIIKAHDPGGTSGTTGDMVFSSLGKKGYDIYMSSSGLARTTVQQCDPRDGTPVLFTKNILANIGSSGQDGVSFDLSPETCRLSVACCIDNDCDDDIDDVWLNVNSLDGNGVGDLKVKIVGKKSPADGSGSISYVGTCDASDPAGGGGEMGVSVTDDGGAVYLFGASIRLYDAGGAPLGSFTYQPGDVDISRMATLASSDLDGRYQWSMVQEFDPAAGRIRQRPDLLAAEWDDLIDVTITGDGTTYPGVARCEIQLLPTLNTPLYFEAAQSLDLLFTAPAGELESAAITDFGLSRFPPPCIADLNGDGILDNGDIQALLAFFLGGDIRADLNGDGLLDNGDIQTFLTAFLAGC